MYYEKKILYILSDKPANEDARSPRTTALAKKQTAHFPKGLCTNVPSSNCNYFFFYPIFPFEGTKSACKNERGKNKSESKRTARTKEKGRAERDRREREGEGAWSLSSRQSPSQAKALSSSSAAQVRVSSPI